MSDDFFTGKWVGEYWYGSDYPGMDQKAPVTFEIHMTLQNGVLKGECLDDETRSHFEKPALVEGTINNNEISFQKKYPYFWDHDDNFKPRFLPKLPAREIKYTGRFENGVFTGEWIITSAFTDETGEIFEYRGSGSWQMHKAN
jgi:hypothetical protein